MPVRDEENLAFFSLNQRELFRRVGWLVQLRWLVIGCVLAGVAVVWCLYKPIKEMRVALALAGVVIGYNLVFAAINRRIHAVPARWKNIAFAWLQIFADLSMLTVVVHLTGGINSVFVIFYMVHMAIAAELLRRAHSFSTAALASVLFDLLVYLENAGVFQRHWSPAFTLGPGGTGETTSLAIVVCLIYNAAFFLTVYVASSISSRLRQSEREIERMNIQLSALNAQKSAFMRMTGHEMRSPLNAIRGLLHVLEKRLKEAGASKESFDLIARCKQRTYAMSDLIGDLLEYSRLQTVTTLEKKRRLDLREVANRAIEELAPVAEAKEIQIRVDVRKCEIEGDEEQLLTLVKNLVSNAVRYTPAAGTVEVSVGPDENRAVLKVKDSGIGISAESLQYVFEEFFRAPEAKEHEPAGTGLGLTLCKTIVERHGGDIQVESEPGRGSIFTVRLPLLEK